MESLRKPFQGVSNIIRFNWHFYVLTLLALLIFFGINVITNQAYSLIIYLFSGGILIVTVISLLVSYYIYDLSNLYTLNWLDKLPSLNKNQFIESRIINIHSGFDETSALLQAKYPNAEMQVFDFYDPIKHTEVSIKRARKAYPPYSKTIQINTDSILLPSETIDHVFVIFSAHEIRDDLERIIFFKELNRILKPSGSIIVTEHLRNIPNFLAYNIGFLHFLPLQTWSHTFKHSNLTLLSKTLITPFITNFVLTKNGDSY